MSNKDFASKQITSGVKEKSVNQNDKKHITYYQNILVIFPQNPYNQRQKNKFKKNTRQGTKTQNFRTKKMLELISYKNITYWIFSVDSFDPSIFEK